MLDPVFQSQLLDSTLFRDVSFASVQPLLGACGRRWLSAGEVLLEPGKSNHNVYLVLSGELRVYLGGRALPSNAVLGVGDCAGEISAIDGKDPSALVIAAESTEILVIPHDALWALVDRCHGIARNLLHIISGRLRNENLNLLMTQSQSQEFEQAACVDVVTGLHNRRWLAESFPRAVQRCEQECRPVCLVMADVDHFKRYNDDYGHLVGDRVLRAVARHLAESLRTQDLIARYGGEEFAILLPHSGLDEAGTIAERLRARVAAMRVEVAPEGRVETATISCGVAALRPGSDLETLIAAADHALYRAKDKGRNRVELASASG